MGRILNCIVPPHFLFGWGRCNVNLTNRGPCLDQKILQFLDACPQVVDDAVRLNLTNPSGVGSGRPGASAQADTRPIGVGSTCLTIQPGCRSNEQFLHLFELSTGLCCEDPRLSHSLHSFHFLVSVPEYEKTTASLKPRLRLKEMVFFH